MCIQTSGGVNHDSICVRVRVYVRACVCVHALSVQRWTLHVGGSAHLLKAGQHKVSKHDGAAIDRHAVVGESSGIDAAQDVPVGCARGGHGK